jgi:hypothetical protein
MREGWISGNASFETRLMSTPQDDGFLYAIKNVRHPEGLRSSRLEGHTSPMQYSK